MKFAMHRFWSSVTTPLLAAAAPSVIVEIGAEAGDNSRHILSFCIENKTRLYVIDPVPALDIAEFEAQSAGLAKVLAQKSLDALKTIPAMDVILIDGDHNWYTVYNELKEIERLSTERGAMFPLITFHDIGWPYGRRDMYYNPTDIPEEYRQPIGSGGLIPDQSAQAAGNKGLNKGVLNALNEGGERNGVRTAVEDFMKESSNSLSFVFLPVYNGYGILFADDVVNQNPNLKDIISRLTPSKELCDLMMSTEMNRIQRTIMYKQLERGIRRLAGDKLGWRIIHYLSR